MATAEATARLTAVPADGAAERTEQRRDIQGLRGIAVLLVVAYHARLPHVSSGFIGVDVFFVISGFVITAMLCRELEGSGRISLPRFYARRAKRLLPALAVVLVVVTFLGSLLFDSFATWQIADRTSIWASLFSSNYYLYSLPDGYFAVDTSLNPLLHTWTLGVEEQFYVLFPLLLIAGWHVARRYGAFALIGAGALASLALARHETYQPSARAEHFAFFSAPTRAWEFAAGALLAVGAPLVARVPRPVAFAGVVAGGAILLWAATGPSGDFERAAVYACAASVLLIAAGTATRRAGAPFGSVRSCGSATARTAGTSGTGSSSSMPRH